MYGLHANINTMNVKKAKIWEVKLISIHTLREIDLYMQTHFISPPFCTTTLS